MKTKAEKHAILADLQGEFAECDALVVCKFDGLTVAEDQEFRAVVRSTESRYRVVSNRLAYRAARDTPFEDALKGQRGMTGLAFLGSDIIQAAKAIVGFAKSQEHFSLHGAVIEGRTLDSDGLVELSRLPGREGIYAQLLFLINSPAQRLLGTVSAPGRNVAAVVHQGVEEQKFGG